MSGPVKNRVGTNVCGNECPGFELVQTINKYAIKKIDKIKNRYIILVSGKFSTNLYVKSICFAEIMALNECLRSGM